MSAIICRSPTEMMELAVSMLALQSALVLILPHRDPALLFSWAFGCVLMAWGLAMLLGALSNWAPLKIVASLGMMGARLYMMTMCLQAEWRNASWVPHLIGAVMCAWIFQRVMCRERARFESARRLRRRATDEVREVPKVAREVSHG